MRVGGHLARYGRLARRVLEDPELTSYLEWEQRSGPLARVRASAKIIPRLVIEALRRIGIHPGISRRRRAEQPVAPGRGAYLFDSESIEGTRVQVRARFPERVARLIDDGDRIRSGQIPIFSGALWHDLTMSGWTCGFADQEELFYLNRWYHGVTLAKAAVYAESSTYADVFEELWSDWESRHPVDSRSPVWESYSVSERIANLVMSTALLETVDGTAALRAKLRGTLEIHARYLAGHLEAETAHNHLLNNARALFLYGMTHPGDAHAARYATLGWEILTRELQRQFFVDGMLAEQSTHYHLLVLSRYLECTLVARRNAFPLWNTLTVPIARMLEVAEHFVRRDGTLIVSGDVSPDESVTELVPVLHAAASFLGRRPMVELNEKYCWFLAAEDRGRLVEKREVADSVLLAGGYGFLARGKIQVMLRCDPRAKVVRHGHHDPLAVEVCFDGQVVIAGCSGRSTFTVGAGSDYFAGPESHSTVVVDRQHPFVRSETLRRILPPSYVTAAASLTNGRKGETASCWVEASHSGYERLSGAVSVRRRVTVSSHGTVVVEDRISCERGGPHLVEILFHLRENVALPDGACEFVIHDPGGRYLCRFAVHADLPVTIELARGLSEGRRAAFDSPSYGVSRESSVLRACVEVSGVLNVVTRLRFGESGC